MDRDRGMGKVKVDSKGCDGGLEAKAGAAQTGKGTHQRVVAAGGSADLDKRATARCRGSTVWTSTQSCSVEFFENFLGSASKRRNGE